MGKRKSKNVNVTLRYKMLPSGKESLYLDFYPPIEDTQTGALSRREGLSMFVSPLRDKSGKLLKDDKGNNKYSVKDKETIRLAKTIVFDT